MPVSGDLKNVSVNHPELGSRTFEAKTGEDFTYMTGGYKSNDDDGNIGVAGSRIDQLNRYPWSAELTLVKNIDDHDFLQNLSENPVEGDWTFEHISGEVRVGKGKPVGDIASNFQAGTIALKCAGSGRLEKIT
jgi:hypothetical protein